MEQCMICQLIARRDAGAAPPWNCIHRTEFWDIVHSYNTALPGWLVLVARRHIETLHELTMPEAVELGVLIRQGLGGPARRDGLPQDLCDPVCGGRRASARAFQHRAAHGRPTRGVSVRAKSGMTEVMASICMLT